MKLSFTCRGTIHSLGADAREEPMAESDYRKVDELLGKSGNQLLFQRVQTRGFGSHSLPLEC